ncbi:MAG: ATP-binding cassette domain-containing protein [Lachnospiraceae bacterium]|nr:ATP-binding cassette domain-containing protein [Lachnospiraceae bacterium]
MRNSNDGQSKPSTDGRSRLRQVLSRCRIPLYLLISLAVWVALWQYKAGKMNSPVLLPYPKDVWAALRELVGKPEFSAILLGSLKHIMTGFAMALVCGIVLAIICRFSLFAEMLLLPPMKLVKTVPVVSFIILLLLWVDPARISIVISFLIVLPVVYANVSKGIRETPKEMLEMAKVFGYSFLRKLRYLFIPNTVPYTTAAVSTGLSLCWKAGIAAEIIGLSKNSIGRQLYDSKLYLDTPALFAWTVVVILVSVVMEWLIMIVLRAVAIAIADPTLWYRPRQALRFLVGLPVLEDRTAEEEVEENSSAELKAAEGTGSSAGPEDSVDTGSGEAGVSGGEPADRVDQDNEPVVVLDHVDKSYNGRAVLTDVSVELRKGEVMLITGPSGGGKTTMLRCMLGLVRPDSGTVTYPAGRPRMAAVFQEDRLCEGLPAWKNVALAIPGRTGRETRNSILSELSELGIDDGARKPVRAFSGGMKRRTAWLRALTVKPDLLVLDEPFTGLDAARKDILLERMHSVAETTAIAIVTHNTSEIEKICATFENVIRVTRGE